METEQLVDRKPFPVLTRQVAALVNGTHTDIVLSAFLDKIFIAVSQTGKFGTIVIFLQNVLFIMN